ncbi:MAG: hypothetical protein K8T10_03660 [Candidatus Eremiobacteraeota bacterium]|nr:hypothetical protein [Candidatus Eremiobacteraeota bacterium]
MQLNRAGSTGEVSGPGVSRAGSEMSLGETLGELKFSLDGLKEKELEATSIVIKTFQSGGGWEYKGFMLIKDDSNIPRCPHERLPVKNKALKGITDNLISAYGKKAKGKVMSFLRGGLPCQGYCKITLAGTGLGLYFDKETGEPMGKLTGEI